jgi:hypothetical protein
MRCHPAPLLGGGIERHERVRKAADEVMLPFEMDARTFVLLTPAARIAARAEIAQELGEAAGRRARRLWPPFSGSSPGKARIYLGDGEPVIR